MRKRAVSYLIGILTAAIIAFDVYLFNDGTPGNTYSERLTAWSANHFWVAHAIVAGLGLLAWHWFRDTSVGSHGPGWSALALLCSFAVGGLVAELIGFY